MATQITPGNPGWFPDPEMRFDARYWDGLQWTKAVMRGDGVDTDPEALSAPFVGGATNDPDGFGDPTSAMAGEDSPTSPTDRITSLSPDEAQSRVSQLLAMASASVRRSEPGRLHGTVQIEGKPNMLVLTVLIFMWLVPGILYWYAKSRPEPRAFTLQFVPNNHGTRIVINADQDVLGRLSPVFSQLPW
jgi:hypothetical protein